MKKLFITSTIIMLLCFSCSLKNGPYKDGVYKGKSQAQYTNEPYVGYIIITIKNGWPIDADFKIVDTLKKELFNESYEKYFEGNENYIEQCRNDWRGVQTYPEILRKIHDLDKLDAMTGATWSFNFFKFAAIDALKTAKK